MWRCGRVPDSSCFANVLNTAPSVALMAFREDESLGTDPSSRTIHSGPVEAESTVSEF